MRHMPDQSWLVQLGGAVNAQAKSATISGLRLVVGFSVEDFKASQVVLLQVAAGETGG